MEVELLLEYYKEIKEKIEKRIKRFKDNEYITIEKDVIINSIGSYETNVLSIRLKSNNQKLERYKLLTVKKKPILVYRKLEKGVEVRFSTVALSIIKNRHDKEYIELWRKYAFTGLENAIEILPYKKEGELYCDIIDTTTGKKIVSNVKYLIFYYENIDTLEKDLEKIKEKLLQWKEKKEREIETIEL